MERGSSNSNAISRAIIMPSTAITSTVLLVVVVLLVLGLRLS